MSAELLAQKERLKKKMQQQIRKTYKVSLKDNDTSAKVGPSGESVSKKNDTAVDDGTELHGAADQNNIQGQYRYKRKYTSAKVGLSGGLRN
jgi:hypothetical protein